MRISLKSKPALNTTTHVTTFFLIEQYHSRISYPFTLYPANLLNCLKLPFINIYMQTNYSHCSYSVFIYAMYVQTLYLLFQFFIHAGMF